MSNTIKNEPLVKSLKKAFNTSKRRTIDHLADEEVDQNPYDTWHAKQHGEEYRYAQQRSYRNAKRAYQAAIELAQQKVTHQAFYMEDLGKTEDVKANTPAPTLNLNTPKKYMLPTRFYPDGGQNDKVTKVQKVGRVQLQRIYPNYELSTSDTRESGLGPQIEVAERYTNQKKQG